MAEEPVGRGRRALAWLGAAACCLYLLNPGWGVFEFLPDNLPGLGNLDEAGVTVLLLACIRIIARGRGRSGPALPHGPDARPGPGPGP